jgi:hypothetical protein
MRLHTRTTCTRQRKHTDMGKACSLDPTPSANPIHLALPFAFPFLANLSFLFFFFSLQYDPRGALQGFASLTSGFLIWPPNPPNLLYSNYASLSHKHIASDWAKKKLGPRWGLEGGVGVGLAIGPPVLPNVVILQGVLLLFGHTTTTLESSAAPFLAPPPLLHLSR